MSDVNFKLQVLKMVWLQTRDKHQLHDSKDISLQAEIEGCSLMLQFKQAAGLRALSAVCALSHFSHVRLLATPWTVAHQAPLSVGFSSKNTGVGCRALLQGIFLTQGSNLHLLQLLHCRQILNPLTADQTAKWDSRQALPTLGMESMAMYRNRFTQNSTLWNTFF